jgi:hypothetical protein
MATVSTPVDVSCAVEVFVATALLHIENPGRSEFTIQRIIRRAEAENITGEMRSGVGVHATLHCVANKAPNPGKHKMLFATGKHTRRLLLPGDEVHQDRTGKVFPDAGEIPEKYLPLLKWAKQHYEDARKDAGMHSAKQDSSREMPAEQNEQTSQGWLQGLLDMDGLGKEYWEGVDPDEFVRKLREGWE